MSAFEDELRRAMAGHDDEAPRAEDLLRSLEQAAPRRRRGQWYLPFAVAVAVTAVVLGGVWVGKIVGDHQPQRFSAYGTASSSGTASAPVTGTPSVTGTAARGHVTTLTCPARYAKQAPWVPARPAGVDGRSRLVPQQTPSAAFICAYDGTNAMKQQAGWALSGRRSLAGDLAGLARQLTWQARKIPGQEIACTLIGGAQTNYLIGLSYPGGGTTWVAATAEPNECVSASNGEFTSTGAIGPMVRKAFVSGRWPARPAVACNQPFQDIGRLGEDKAMVPASPTSLTICAPKAHRTVTSGYHTLVRALNQLPARPSDRSCSGSPGPRSFYQLFFSYAEGPSAIVNITVGCNPEIDNLSLQSASAGNVMPEIQQLLKAK